MLWYFELVSEESGKYSYRYSRENEALDGIIWYDSNANEIEIVQLSELDKKYPKAQQWTLEKFYSVIRNGFPSKLQIACG